jgi:hypothetical protein
MVTGSRFIKGFFKKVRSMTAENFNNVLNSLRLMKPYRVFTVELHGGQRFEVDHPGALVVRDGVAVFLAPGGVPIWFDHDSVNQIIGDQANKQPDQEGEIDSA